MEKNVMQKCGMRVLVAAALGLLVSSTVATTSRADTGAVRVVFTKGGFIIGAGGGRHEVMLCSAERANSSSARQRASVRESRLGRRNGLCPTVSTGGLDHARHACTVLISADGRCSSAARGACRPSG